jgi:hypothetical protein
MAQARSRNPDRCPVRLDDWNTVASFNVGGFLGGDENMHKKKAPFQGLFLLNLAEAVGFVLTVATCMDAGFHPAEHQPYPISYPQNFATSSMTLSRH